MTRSEVIAMMPKVGDILMQKPVGSTKKEKCKVVFVHHTHFWYAAEFGADDGYKFTECFKLPKWNYHPVYDYTPVERATKRNEVKGEVVPPEGSVREARTPVRCKIVETGAIFKSICSCARTLGTDSGTVHRVINQGGTIYGYHIVKA
jgi:hypothetical protein